MPRTVHLSRIAYLTAQISQALALPHNAWPSSPTRHLLFHNLHFLPTHLRARLFISLGFSSFLSTSSQLSLFLLASPSSAPSPSPVSCNSSRGYCSTGRQSGRFSKHFCAGAAGRVRGSHLINYTNVEALIPANALSARSSC